MPTAADRTALTTVVESRVGVLQYLPRRTARQFTFLVWRIPATATRPDRKYRQAGRDGCRSCCRNRRSHDRHSRNAGAHRALVCFRIPTLGATFAPPKPCSQRDQERNDAWQATSAVGVRDRMASRHCLSSNLMVSSTEQLHLLKIDVEADAVTILNGATETLWRLRPLLFIAAPDDGALDAIVALIRELGYRSWRIQTPLHNPGNFYRRQEDIFSGKSNSRSSEFPRSWMSILTSVNVSSCDRPQCKS